MTNTTTEPTRSCAYCLGCDRCAYADDDLFGDADQEASTATPSDATLMADPHARRAWLMAASLYDLARDIDAAGDTHAARLVRRAHALTLEAARAVGGTAG